VLVAALPGALSAFGILGSDVVRDYSRTVLLALPAGSALPRARIAARFRELEQQAGRDLRAQGWRGRIRFRRTLDVRYRGQGYELNVDFGPRLLQDFSAQHERRYGYAHAARDIEIVTLRLRASIAAAAVEGKPRAEPSIGGGARRGSILFQGRRMAGALLERDSLPVGRSYAGPAILTEYSATTVVPPGWRFHADRAGNLVIARR
jgi:N-methylhydantoinase A